MAYIARAAPGSEITCLGYKDYIIGYSDRVRIFLNRYPGDWGLSGTRHGSARLAACAASDQQLALHAQRTAGLLHVARSAPGQDTQSGQGALARRHTDGPLWAALLKTTVMCEAWQPTHSASLDPCLTSFWRLLPEHNSPSN
jgi:hypothetical protein